MKKIKFVLNLFIIALLGFLIGGATHIYAYNVGSEPNINDTNILNENENDKKIRELINSENVNEYNEYKVSKDFPLIEIEKIYGDLPVGKDVKIHILDNRIMLSYYVGSDGNNELAHVEYFNYEISIPKERQTIFNYLGVSDIYIATKNALINSGEELNFEEGANVNNDITAVALAKSQGIDPILVNEYYFNNLPKRDNFYIDYKKGLIYNPYSEKMFIGAGYKGRLPVIDYAQKYFNQEKNKFDTELFALRKLYRRNEIEKWVHFAEREMFQEEEKQKLLNYIKSFNLFVKNDYNYSLSFETDYSEYHFRRAHWWDRINSANIPNNIFKVSERLDTSKYNDELNRYGKKIFERYIPLNPTEKNKKPFIEDIKEIPFFKNNIGFYVGDFYRYSPKNRNNYPVAFITYGGQVKINFNQGLVKKRKEKIVLNGYKPFNYAIKQGTFNRVRDFIKDIENLNTYKVENNTFKVQNISNINNIDFTKISTHFYLRQEYLESLKGTLFYYYINADNAKMQEEEGWYFYGVKVDISKLRKKLEQEQNYILTQTEINEFSNFFKNIINEYLKDKNVYAIKDTSIKEFIKNAIVLNEIKTTNKYKATINGQDIVFKSEDFDSNNISNLKKLISKILLLKNYRLDNISLRESFINSVKIEIEKETKQNETKYYYVIKYKVKRDSTENILARIEIAKVYNDVQSLANILNNREKYQIELSDLENITTNKEIVLYRLKKGKEDLIKDYYVFTLNTFKKLTKKVVNIDYYFDNTKEFNGQEIFAYLNNLKEIYKKIYLESEKKTLEDIILTLTLTTKSLNYQDILKNGIENKKSSLLKVRFTFKEFLNEEINAKEYLEKKILEKILSQQDLLVKKLNDKDLFVIKDNFTLTLKTYYENNSEKREKTFTGNYITLRDILKVEYDSFKIETKEIVAVKNYHLVYALVNLEKEIVEYVKDLNNYNQKIDEEYVFNFYKKYFKKDEYSQFILTSFQTNKEKIEKIIEKEYKTLTSEERELLKKDLNFYSFLKKVVIKIAKITNENSINGISAASDIVKEIPVFILEIALVNAYNTKQESDINERNIKFQLESLIKENDLINSFYANVNYANNITNSVVSINENSNSYSVKINEYESDIESIYKNVFFKYELGSKTYYFEIIKENEEYYLSYLEYSIDETLLKETRQLDFIKDNLIQTNSEEQKVIELKLNDTKTLRINLLRYKEPKIDLKTIPTNKIINGENVKTNIISFEVETVELGKIKEEEKEKYIFYDSTNTLNKNIAFLIGIEFKNNNSQLLELNGTISDIDYYDFFQRSQVNNNYKTYNTTNERIIKVKEALLHTNELELNSSASSDFERYLQSYNFENYKQDYLIYSQFFAHTLEKEGSYTLIYYYFSQGKIFKVEKTSSIKYGGSIFVERINEKKSDSYLKKNLIIERENKQLEKIIPEMVFENDITLRFSMYEKGAYITNNIQNNYFELKRVNVSNYESNKDIVGYLAFVRINGKTIKIIETESSNLEYLIETKEGEKTDISFSLYKVKPYLEEGIVKYSVINTILKDMQIVIDKRKSSINIDNNTKDIQDFFEKDLIVNNFINESDLNINFNLGNNNITNAYLRINVFEYALDKDIKKGTSVGLNKAINEKPILIDIKTLENTTLESVINKIIIDKETLRTKLIKNPLKKYLVVYEIIEKTDNTNLTKNIDNLGREIQERRQQRANAFIYFKDGQIEIKKEKGLNVENVLDMETIFLSRDTKINFEKEIGINVFLFEKREIDIDLLKKKLIEKNAISKEETLKEIRENQPIELSDTLRVRLDAREKIIKKSGKYNFEIALEESDFNVSEKIMLVIDNFNNVKLYRVVYIKRNIDIDFNGVESEDTNKIIEEVLESKQLLKENGETIYLKDVINISKRYYIDYIDYSNGIFNGKVKDFLFTITKNHYEKEYIESFEFSILKYSYNGINYNEDAEIDFWLKQQIENNFYLSVLKAKNQSGYTKEHLIEELKENLKERQIEIEEDFTIFSYYKQLLNYVVKDNQIYYKDQLKEEKENYNIVYKYYEIFKEFIKKLEISGNKNQYLSNSYKNFIANNFNFIKDLIYYNENKENQYLDNFTFLETDFERYVFNKERENSINKYLEGNKDNRIFLFFEIITKSGLRKKYYVELVNDKDLKVGTSYQKEKENEIENIKNEIVFDIQESVEKAKEYNINGNLFVLTQDQIKEVNILLANKGLEELSEVLSVEQIEVLNTYLNSANYYKYNGENVLDLEEKINGKDKYITSNSKAVIEILNKEKASVYINEIIDIKINENKTTFKYKDIDFKKVLLDENKNTFAINDSGYYRIVVIDKRGNKKDFLILITSSSKIDIKINESLVIIPKNIQDTDVSSLGYYFEKEEEKLLLNTRYNVDFIFKKENKNNKYIKSIEIDYQANKDAVKEKVYTKEKELENQSIRKNGYYLVVVEYNNLAKKYLKKENLTLYIFKDSESPYLEIGDKKEQNTYKNKNNLTNNKVFSEKEYGNFVKGQNEEYILSFKVKDNFNNFSKIEIYKEKNKIKEINDIGESEYYNLVIFGKNGLINALYNDKEQNGNYTIKVYDKLYNEKVYKFSFKVLSFENSFKFEKDTKEIFTQKDNQYGNEIIINEENDNNEFVLYKKYYNESYLDFKKLGNNNYKIVVKDSFKNEKVLLITINDGIMFDFYNKENTLYKYEHLNKKKIIHKDYEDLYNNSSDEERRELLEKHGILIKNDIVYFENLTKLNKENAPDFENGVVVFLKERNYYNFKKGVKNVRYSFVSFEKGIENIENEEVVKNKEGQYFIRHNNNGILKIEFESVFNKGVVYKIYSVLLDKQEMIINISYDMFSIFESKNEMKVNPLIEKLLESEIDFNNMGRLKLTFNKNGLINAYYNDINLLEKGISKNEILKIQDFYNTSDKLKEKQGVQIELENIEKDKLLSFEIKEGILPNTVQVRDLINRYNNYYKKIKEYQKQDNLILVEKDNYLKEYKTLHNFIDTNNKKYTKIIDLKRQQVEIGKIEYEKDKLISNRPFYLIVLENKEKVENKKTYEYKTYYTNKEIKDKKEQENDVNNLKIEKVKHIIYVSIYDKKLKKYVIDLYKNFSHNTRDNSIKVNIFNFNNRKDNFIEKDTFTIKYRANSMVYLIVAIGIVIFIILSTITIILIIKKNRV